MLGECALAGEAEAGEAAGVEARNPAGVEALAGGACGAARDRDQGLLKDSELRLP